MCQVTNALSFRHFIFSTKSYLGHLSAVALVNNKILLFFFFFFKCYIVSLHLFLRTGGDFQRGVVGSGCRSVLKELSVEQSHS